MTDKPVVGDDGARVSDTEKSVESGCVSTELHSQLDQFEDPDQGLSVEERAKKVSDTCLNTRASVGRRIYVYDFIGTCFALETRPEARPLAVLALSHLLSRPVRCRPR